MTRRVVTTPETPPQPELDTAALNRLINSAAEAVESVTQLLRLPALALKLAEPVLDDLAPLVEALVPALWRSAKQTAKGQSGVDIDALKTAADPEHGIEAFIRQCGYEPAKVRERIAGILGKDTAILLEVPWVLMAALDHLVKHKKMPGRKETLDKLMSISDEEFKEATADQGCAMSSLVIALVRAELGKRRGR